MSVNEKLMAPGTFNVSLNLVSTPNSVVNAITPWGNIVLTPTRISPEEFTDSQIRDMARYVGIVQSQTISEESIEVEGMGILGYLGDTDSRGMVLARNAGVGAVRSYVGDTLNDVLDRSSSTPYGILRDESGAQRAVRKGTVTEVSFDDTVLLLNFDGSNGATTTTDGSAFTSNQVITFSGTSEISTTQNKFGGSSLKLTTDGFLTVADRPELDLTYHDFTVEWWEYRTSTSGNPTVLARNNDTFSPYIIGKAVSGRNKAFITHDGTSYSATEGIDIDMGSIDLNQWNHFAIVRKGESFRTFKNGVIQQTDTRPDLFVRVSSDSLQIGKGQNGNFFEGFIDGLRIVRGTAIYFDAFTPSTSAPTATTANRTYTGKHYMESAYKSIKTICTTVDAEFKMQNDGTIDVGPKTSIFTGHGTQTPTGIIVRRLSGPDPEITGYSGIDLTTEFNAEDFVSRVELIASNYGAEINLGQADERNVPYKDLHGNALERIQILSENDIPESMRDIRAEAYLNEFNKVQKTLNVGLENYDVSGDIETGDVIFVYDPDVGFEDTSTDASLENRSRHEIVYQGQILHPIKIRVMGLSFPIVDTMGVFYRDGDGNYTDLTDYVIFESGTTQIEVGTTKKQINQDLRGAASVISIGGANEFTVPDAPTGLAAATGTYQDGSGRPFAFARLTWNEPTNTDGSRIIDGNMYRVRYRQVTDVDGNNLIDSNDNQITDYEYLTVEFGTQAVVIKGLGPNNSYEFGVAAIDNSGFSGGFATITSTQMPNDSIAPPQPTAPTGTFGSIAASADNVQIQHKLGAAKTVAGAVINSPTNFTLPRDIDHLNVYRGASSGFTIASNNFVGEIQARAGHIDGNITAIGSFQTSTAGTAYYKVTAVDVAGNESEASTAAEVTETLIDTAFINDAAITTAKVGDAQITDAKIDTLTASKITAGSITGKEIIVDTDNTDNSNPVLGKIRSSNYSSGSAGWIINSDGSVEFSSGTFRGALAAATGTFAGSLSAATGTFSGSLSAASGTFSGDISGASGTFTGDLSGSNISGGTIDIGGSDSTSFHVDSDGNMFLGASTLGSAPFKVSNAGAVTATSGTIGGISLGSTSISSSNFSGSSAGFQVTSGGDATFNSITVNNPVITLSTNSGSGVPTSASSSILKLGTATLFERSNKVFTSKPFVVFPDGDEDNPSLTISGDYDEMGFFVSNSTDFGGFSTFSASNGDDDIFSFNTLSTQFNVKGNLSVEGNTLTVNGDSGSNNQFLGKDSSGNLGYHNVSTGSHSHTESDISNIGSHDHASDASWLSGYATTSTVNALSTSLTNHVGHSTVGTGISQINSPSTGFFSGYTFNSTTGAFSVSTSNTNTSSTTVGNLFPNASSSDLGHPFGNGEWDRLYIQNNPNVSSDERKKENIEDLTFGLDYIKTLVPKSYSLKSDENSKIHWGFIAQQLLETPPEPDLDVAFVDYQEEHDHYSVAYAELIAPLVKAVQELSAKNDELESRLAALEG